MCQALEALQQYIIVHQTNNHKATTVAAEAKNGATQNGKQPQQQRQQQHPEQQQQQQQQRHPVPQLSSSKSNKPNGTSITVSPTTVSASSGAAPETQPSKPQSNIQPSTTTTTAPLAHLPADVRLEHQKKLAAERRRKDLELQRKLARAEIRYKDLEAKRQFWETDKRKKELMVSSSSSANTNTAALLQQNEQKMAVILRDMAKVTNEMNDIQAEIERRKQEALQTQKDAMVDASKFVAATRLAEQVPPPVSKLEEQKRVAVEKRRRQLEEERQRAREETKRQEEEKRRLFLEQERRKQELMEQAMVKKSGLDDLDLLQGLNQHVTQFDAQEGGDGKKEDDDSNDVVHSSLDDEPDQPSSIDAYPQSPSAKSHATSFPFDEEAPNPTHDRTHNETATDSAAATQQPPHARIPSQTSSKEKQRQQPQKHIPHHHAPSEIDHKYEKMVTDQQDENDPSLYTELKRNILVHWALRPPYMQSLRPIYELLCTIHTVYPPAFGMAHHEHFDRWQVIVESDLKGYDPTVFDEKKLTKAVRKVRFFLHPDRRPRDLSEQHQFVCTLLWDVMSDAFEDHKMAKEELDWIG